MPQAPDLGGLPASCSLGYLHVLLFPLTYKPAQILNPRSTVDIQGEVTEGQGRRERGCGWNLQDLCCVGEAKNQTQKSSHPESAMGD